MSNNNITIPNTTTSSNSSNSSNSIPKLKVIFLGDSYCGKSNLMSRLLFDQYDNTISGGQDIKDNIMKMRDGTRYYLWCNHPWSIGGMGYKAKFDFSFQPDVIVMVFSFNDHNSFKQLVNDWYPTILRFTPHQDTPIYLIGNKCDVSDDAKEVCEEEIDQFINFTRDVKNITITSNRTNDNKDDLTTTLYHNLPIVKYYQISTRDNINIKEFYNECLLPHIEEKIVMNGLQKLTDEKMGGMSQHIDVDFEDNNHNNHDNDRNNTVNNNHDNSEKNDQESLCCIM